jgi:hypothetical protein
VSSELRRLLLSVLHSPTINYLTPMTQFWDAEVREREQHTGVPHPSLCL